MTAGNPDNGWQGMAAVFVVVFVVIRVICWAESWTTCLGIAVVLTFLIQFVAEASDRTGG